MNVESRAILINQYELLKNLDPERSAEYERYQEILSSGYTTRYSDVLGAISAEEASAEMQRETLDILSMFRVLDNSKRAGWKPSDEDASKFQGFDGNNDPHYHFANFLFDNGEYTESDTVRNSHSSFTIDRYRRMIRVWKSFDNKHKLDPAQAEKVISA